MSIAVSKQQIDELLEARIEGEAWFLFDDLKQKRAIQNAIDFVNLRLKDDYKIKLSQDVIEIENRSVLLALALISFAFISEGESSAKKLKNLGGVVLEDGECEDECSRSGVNWHFIAELLKPYTYSEVRKIPILVSH